MKIIVPLISASLVINWLLYLFCHFVETKNKNEVFRKMAVLLREVFVFFFIVSRPLLQRLAEFNRLL